MQLICVCYQQLTFLSSSATHLAPSAMPRRATECPELTALERDSVGIASREVDFRCLKCKNEVGKQNAMRHLLSCVFKKEVIAGWVVLHDTRRIKNHSGTGMMLTSKLSDVAAQGEHRVSPVIAAKCGGKATLPPDVQKALVMSGPGQMGYFKPAHAKWGEFYQPTMADAATQTEPGHVHVKKQETKAHVKLEEESTDSEEVHRPSKKLRASYTTGPEHGVWGLISKTG